MEIRSRRGILIYSAWQGLKDFKAVVSDDNSEIIFWNNSEIIFWNNSEIIFFIIYKVMKYRELLMK